MTQNPSRIEPPSDSFHIVAHSKVILGSNLQLSHEHIVAISELARKLSLFVDLPFGAA